MLNTAISMQKYTLLTAFKIAYFYFSVSVGDI